METADSGCRAIIVPDAGRWRNCIYCMNPRELSTKPVAVLINASLVWEIVLSQNKNYIPEYSASFGSDFLFHATKIEQSHYVFVG